MELSNEYVATLEDFGYTEPKAKVSLLSFDPFWVLHCRSAFRF
jgi:hypothetical protein